MHFPQIHRPNLHVPTRLKDHSIRNKLKETAALLQRDQSREPGRINVTLPSLKPSGIAMHIMQAQAMHVAFALNNSTTSLVSVGSPVDQSVKLGRSTDSLVIRKSTTFDVSSEIAPDIVEITEVDVTYEDTATGKELPVPLSSNMTPLEEMLSPIDHSLEVILEETALEETHALKP